MEDKYEYAVKFTIIRGNGLLSVTHIAKGHQARKCDAEEYARSFRENGYDDARVIRRKVGEWEEIDND